LPHDLWGSENDELELSTENRHKMRHLSIITVSGISPACTADSSAFRYKKSKLQKVAESQHLGGLPMATLRPQRSTDHRTVKCSNGYMRVCQAYAKLPSRPRMSDTSPVIDEPKRSRVLAIHLVSLSRVASNYFRFGAQTMAFQTRILHRMGDWLFPKLWIIL
jgi:hypothetical protein